MTQAAPVPVDVVVIGGGPAGRAAAVAAALQGLDVLLLDEGSGEPCDIGPAAALFDHVVWSVTPSLRIDALGPEGTKVWMARAVVAATGAEPFILPFPGWALPRITSLAAAAAEPAAGGRTLVAGSGPQLAATAGAIAAAGGTVVAVVERGAATPPEPASPLRRPDAAGVPVLARHAIVEAAADAAGLSVTVGPVDGAGRFIPGGTSQTFATDRLAVEDGAVPRLDVTRLLRADHRFDDALGAWRPVRDADGRSSRSGLSVAGATAGLFGTAALDGRLVGLAAAHDLGRLDAAAFAAAAAPLRAAIEAARSAWHPPAPRFAAIGGLAAAVIVCPCEALTRADIDAAVDEGATSLNQLKAWTRCGMGPCQGRRCGLILTGLLAARGIAPGRSGLWTGRTPLRPLRLERLVGQYAYDDITLPPAAPL